MTAVRCSDPDRIIDAAREWLGTPYRHQASCKGVGSDCLGLVRGVWRELLGKEPQAVPAYTADWAEATGQERLLEAARMHMQWIAADAARRGDVVLFRMISRGPAKHVAILSTDTLAGGRIIHAYSGHCVCETSLTDAWRRKIAGIFRLPPAEG